MVVDPKLEKMFRQCHERKMRLDKKRRLICAAMFCPPALLAVFCFVHSTLAFMSGLMIVMADGTQAVYLDAPCLILSMATAGFAAGQTMLENKALMKASRTFYPIAAIGYAISFLAAVAVYRGSLFDIIGVAVVLGQLGMVFSCALSAVLSPLFQRLYAENETLKLLKGYPHFNPLFMSDAELRKEEISDQKPPEDLTPDERLMWERDMNL